MNEEEYMIDNIEARISCSCHDEDTTREELLKKIKCYNFAIIELGLYLDTHPNDRRAIMLHSSYCRTLKDLKDKYQKVYGPLSIYCPCNKWRWLEEPWASFILEYLIKVIEIYDINYLRKRSINGKIS